MRLRNKETGEIVDKSLFINYNSLAELNAEWEDYEEPKGIKSIGTIGSSVHIEMGSEEEAEKAVEKLKALAEAKEDGLKIKGYYYNHEDLVILADIGKCNKLTLDTLFGKDID